MNQELKIIELFSGIGGFSKGLADAGFNIKITYSQYVITEKGLRLIKNT